MTREEYEEFYNSWRSSQMSGDAFALIANNYIFNLELKIKTLTYNNEAQEIIIRDKTAFVEAITKANSCEGCTHHPLNSNDPYELACESCKRDGNDNFELHIDNAKQ